MKKLFSSLSIFIAVLFTAINTLAQSANTSLSNLASATNDGKMIDSKQMMSAK